MYFSNGQHLVQGAAAEAIFGSMGITVDANEQYFCPLLNISVCPPVESNDMFLMTVFNPIPRSMSHYVRLPLDAGVEVQVFDDTGVSLTLTYVSIPDKVQEIPGRESTAIQEAIVWVENIPALGN